MILFFAFSFLYPSNVIVKGNIRERIIALHIRKSIMLLSFVAMYKTLTEMLKIIAEQMKIMSSDLPIVISFVFNSFPS